MLAQLYDLQLATKALLLNASIGLNQQIVTEGDSVKYFFPIEKAPVVWFAEDATSTLPNNGRFSKQHSCFN